MRLRESLLLPFLTSCHWQILDGTKYLMSRSLTSNLSPLTYVFIPHLQITRYAAAARAKTVSAAFHSSRDSVRLWPS